MSVRTVDECDFCGAIRFRDAQTGEPHRTVKYLATKPGGYCGLDQTIDHRQVHCCPACERKITDKVGEAFRSMKP